MSEPITVEHLRAALTCVVAALDANHIAALHRPDACAVETDALRQLLFTDAIGAKLKEPHFEALSQRLDANIKRPNFGGNRQWWCDCGTANHELRKRCQTCRRESV